MTGVSLAGFKTTAFPQASAVATERLDRFMGKFHGLMTPTTPSGWRYTRFSLRGVSEGKISPCMR